MNAPVRYPHVFSELAIGASLKNRIIMGSMHTGLEDVPDAAERLPPISSIA
jgi:2,4-dienoyl-CoA reductase (NADPH2)